MVDPVERTTAASVVILAGLIWFGVFMTGCGEHEEHIGQPSPTTGQRHLSTSGTSIVDEQGRTVILRGVNYNGIESMLFTEQPPALDDFKKIKRWGFNVIRFPVSWDFIEPERDHYDEDYLRNWVEPVLDFAAQEGIGVILDLHQWNWSSCFVPPNGRGNGIPQWALPAATRAHCPYTGPAATWAMLQAPGDFWHDGDVIERYMELWEMLARRYGERPAMLGYDLFNEPMPPLDIAAADFDRQVLQPFYEALIRRVRAVSPGPLIVYEPSIRWALAVNRFTPMPFDRLVYSPHIYTGGTAGGLTGFKGDPAPLLADIQKAVAEAQAQRVPLYIGEFGIGLNKNYQAWIEDEFRFQEQYAVSATWWSMRQHNNATFGLTEFDTRAEKTALLDFVSRPYPAATAGSLTAFSYADDSKTFTMTFSNQPSVTGPTVVAIPDYQFPSGIRVQSSDPEGRWRYAYDPVAGLLQVNVDDTQPVHTLSITPDAG